MTIKNNDDVAHLLDATGRVGVPYREFESSTNPVSAPLIDAVFGKDPPSPDPEDGPLRVGPGSSGDLLAEVFDHAPSIGNAKTTGYGAGHREAAGQHSAPEIRPTASASVGPLRSLNDIRRIISQPVDKAARSPSTDSLNGLFDRLAS
jgi:hypothetical protein